MHVSISDEMPGPWRLQRERISDMGLAGFNLRRDASPLATSNLQKITESRNRFKAQTRCKAPGASTIGFVSCCIGLFQSQTRCQAPGDLYIHVEVMIGCNVSISDEMPGPWRRDLVLPSPTRIFVCVFQSQTRCQAPGDPS